MALSLSSFLEKWLVAYTTLRNAALSRPDLSNSMTVPGGKVSFPLMWIQRMEVLVHLPHPTRPMLGISIKCHDSKSFLKVQLNLCAPSCIREIWSCISGSSCFGVRWSVSVLRVRPSASPPAPAPARARPIPVGRRARSPVCV